MTRRSRSWSLVAAAATLSLLASACSGSGGEGDGDGSGNGAEKSAQGGTFTYALTEPTFLAPAQKCYESECLAVVSVIQEPLLNVDLETGEPVYDGIAESIESEDNTTWTVKLKDGWTFHNGEPVNADAFLRAWNWSANVDNGSDTAGFMSKIEGYDAEKAVESLSGLKKVDDLTLEVTLSAPFSQLPQMMSYTPAWSPIAEECLADLEACNETPIGTGPYKMDGAWRHDQGITVVRNEEYAGEHAGNVDSIEFTMYTDMVAAFRAWQAGELDVTDVDPTMYPTAKSEAGDRQLEEESSAFSYLGLTEKAPFDNPDLRHALSMAIDRQSIIDSILNGLHSPAMDVISPVVPGARDDACEFCEFNPEEAKKLFDEAGGIPGNTITLWFNAGSGHDGWVEAIGNSWKETLGIDFKLEAREWAQYLELRSEAKFTGPYRLSWIVDYPSAENYLRPLYGTNGDVNYYGYSNDAVDTAISEGDAAEDPEEGVAKYQEAADMVLEDMPVIPLWFGKANYVWSENVSGVEYDVNLANIDLRNVSVTG
ncbi:MAG: peptide ABC transporter substrate-binding protein [Nocardioidaceae bacterium]